jgi:hypothetical protein
MATRSKEEEMRPLQEKTPNRSTQATKFRPLLQNGKRTQSQIKHLRSNASYVRMKSLDGFSCLQLGRYCFNPETESSSQGLRNPRLKLASFSKTNSQNDYSTMLPTAGQDHALIPLKYPEFNKTEI